MEVRLKDNVFNAIKNASNDKIPFQKNDISDVSRIKGNTSELQDIESAIAEDGEVDAGEQAFLDALKSGSSITLTNSKGEVQTIDPKSVTFPNPKNVSNVKVGKVVEDVHIEGRGTEGGRLVNLSPVVPAQTHGAKNDFVSKKVYSDPASAQKGFEKSIALLTNPNGNKATADRASEGTIHPKFANGDYHLLDDKGKEISPPRAPKVGDFIRIDVPGGSLANKAGDGHEWVKIKDIKHEGGADQSFERLGITVAPCPPPGKPDTDPNGHFFGKGTTNSFVVERNGNTVTASIHPRNEVINLDAKMDSHDSFIQGSIGAFSIYAGAASHQWESLSKGIANPE